MKIVVGGQVNQQQIAQQIKKIAAEAGADIEVEVMSDLKGARAVKKGEADYYVGACHTGGGGALGMAMSLLTRAKCETVSMPGSPPQEEEIKEALAEGKVAFGFTGSHTEKAVKYIMENILTIE